MNVASHHPVALLVTTLLFASQLYAQVPKAIDGEFIIKMKAAPGEGSQKISAKAASLVGKMGSGVELVQTFQEMGLAHVKVSSKSQEQFLRSNPDVEYIEPNYILSLKPEEMQAAAVPATPTDSYIQNRADIKVRQAWDIAKPYNPEVMPIVAIVDTGINLKHPAFKDSNALWVNQAEASGDPGYDDDRNGYIDDINGWNFAYGTSNVTDDNNHGSHVAGIVVGVGMDVTIYPTRESLVKVMPLKFLDSQGKGSTSRAVQAIEYAVRMGAKVINNSWGGGSYSRALHEAYTYAYDNDVVLVSAAGNDSENIGNYPTYPAVLDVPSNITVASTDDDDDLSYFSNYSSTYAQIAAPGESIYSASKNTCAAPAGCFVHMSGTSMAAPLVAGVVALVMREAPSLSAYQVRSIVLGSGDVVPGLNNVVETSKRVNVYEAVRQAANNSNNTYFNPDYTPVYKANRSLASDSSGGGAGGCGLVKAISDKNNGNGPGQGLPILVSIMLAPLMLLAVLSYQARKQAARAAAVAVPQQRRQYERYNVDEKIQVTIDNQILDATATTISVGGLSFKAENDLQKGSKVKIKLGNWDCEVEGEVVWCSAKKQFGVKFNQVSEAIKDHVQKFTETLTPASQYC